MAAFPVSAYLDARAAAIRIVSSAHRITRYVQSGGAATASVPPSERTTSRANVASKAKADASPVTVGDYAVQAFITLRLAALFPNDAFIAEETSAALRESPELLRQVTGAVRVGFSDLTSLPESPVEPGPKEILDAIDKAASMGGDGARTWVLDPIDGTRGFVARRQYCVALALTHHGTPVVGVLGCPSLRLDPNDASKGTGVVFHAVTGDGAYAVDEPSASRGELGGHVSVDSECDLKGAVFCESVESGHSSHELSARVAGILGVTQPPCRMDSQAKYGAMSRGDFHIFMRFPRGNYIENVWDHAAGVVVIEEAGGRVTDGSGRRLDFSLGRQLDNDNGIVATNGKLHDAVIDAVQTALREQEATESRP